MNEWKCNRRHGRGWTIGKIYRTNEVGFLVDDDGDVRLKPEAYNRFLDGSFEEINVILENE